MCCDTTTSCFKGMLRLQRCRTTKLSHCSRCGGGSAQHHEVSCYVEPYGSADFGFHCCSQRINCSGVTRIAHSDADARADASSDGHSDCNRDGDGDTEPK